MFYFLLFGCVDQTDFVYIKTTTEILTGEESQGDVLMLPAVKLTRER